MYGYVLISTSPTPAVDDRPEGPESRTDLGRGFFKSREQTGSFHQTLSAKNQHDDLWSKSVKSNPD